MRFDSSPLIAVSTTDGSVPVFWFDTVGSDSSSATKGSSIVIVAGKNRAPAKPWARALPACEIVNAVATASRARPLGETSIGLFLIPERGRRSAAGELSASAPLAYRSSGVGVKLSAVGRERERLLGREVGRRPAA